MLQVSVANIIPVPTEAAPGYVLGTERESCNLLTGILSLQCGPGGDARGSHRGLLEREISGLSPDLLKQNQHSNKALVTGTLRILEAQNQ